VICRGECMGYIEGVDRHQVMLFPESLDDYVAPDSTVRVIDEFVRGLDLKALGFRRAVPAKEGAPGYDPRVLLALYIYGYLNRTRSSRRLEAETHRNLELIWLMRKLRPDHKTIAEFRRVHPKQLKQVTRMFLSLCRELGLLDGTLVLIDGTKLRAQSSLEHSYTAGRAARLLQQVETSIAKYLSELDRQDRKEAGMSGPTDPDLARKLEALRARQKELQAIQNRIEQTGEQVSLTDPDSRRMKVRGSIEVCYNAQIAVDPKHALIVAHDVTSAANDQEQLGPMALAAKDNLGAEELEVAADSGYHSPSQIALCEANGITPYVPGTRTSNSAKAGLFTKEDFIYSESRDAYQCPGGHWLERRSQSPTKSGRMLGYYTNPAACRSCPLRAQCTRDKYARRITRRPEDAQVAAMRNRLAERPEMMVRRQAGVEHPFGTLKRGMEMGYFLLRGREGVGGEFSLSVLAYNLKRLMNILGVECLLEVLRRRRIQDGGGLQPV
jgi:transposase